MVKKSPANATPPDPPLSEADRLALIASMGMTGELFTFEQIRTLRGVKSDTLKAWAKDHPQHVIRRHDSGDFWFHRSALRELPG